MQWKSSQGLYIIYGLLWAATGLLGLLRNPSCRHSSVMAQACCCTPCRGPTASFAVQRVGNCGFRIHVPLTTLTTRMSRIQSLDIL